MSHDMIAFKCKEECRQNIECLRPHDEWSIDEWNKHTTKIQEYGNIRPTRSLVQLNIIVSFSNITLVNLIKIYNLHEKFTCKLFIGAIGPSS